MSPDAGIFDVPGLRGYSIGGQAQLPSNVSELANIEQYYMSECVLFGVEVGLRTESGQLARRAERQVL